MRDDRGSVSLVAVGVAGVLVTVTALACQYGAALVERHRLEGVADLGALAAANGVILGASPCARAERVAHRMGGRVEDCSVDGEEVVVEIAGRSTVFGTPRARAAAGPVQGP
ncbi:hypothetical protein GCM10022243_65950 [Saccharothrix violaceirubra]|uniref:Secretion/DNA translocation related TadE-like protein n=1 Tax=Saccharothrix violaceirubra TaxID=413306 RepID=A0A7W7T9B5_9PSEU|nr:Rv3654c family TadE-like protein [Saccharothrix violaceirubra]MBB4968919.1 secretion/DNA translocation related TadE-like protein [Saccharothrix violaceirubra]